MKKLRKHTQLSLLNPKRAGRPAIHDSGIRHTKRFRLKKPSSLHLTIKVRENKADIQNKRILKALHNAIRRARLKGLKIVHYTLEYNHVHLLVESMDNKILHKGMQAFGITIAKAINKIKRTKGAVYKNRYHLRVIDSPRQLKNVLHYIFSNGIKHKRTKSQIDLFNSMIAEEKLNILYPKEAKKIWADIQKSEFLKVFQIDLYRVLSPGEIYFKSISYLT
ncbi:transposase [Bacteriovorax sp. PP10]|uniref:Transposase n=1 Tax=Bacteriovorax antarcticus TaxID=3088717 RepID=A0ABU5VQ97_9BACT|nr:transposase [Bacteriovorax sp. PP10]MEA9355221.1 transposase [Bacteriovorax sp. PP10]